MNCRICGSQAAEVFDFGLQPRPQDFLERKTSIAEEFPLILHECAACGLGQIPEFVSSEKNYFRTRISESYLEALRSYYQMYFQNFPTSSKVLEIGCNDGSLLKILKEPNIGCTNLLGIEVDASLAEEACAFSGVEVLNTYFSSSAGIDAKFDLIILNNVLGEALDLRDFLVALSKCSHEKTQIIVEVQNYDLLKKFGFWDMVYHEQLSYFDAYSLCRLFFEFGFNCRALQAISHNAGSIRAIFSKLDVNEQTHSEPRKIAPRIFCPEILTDKHVNLSQILSRKQQNKKIACFGASSKGISWLNFLGLTHYEVDFCIDETPGKHGKFLPGSYIPVVSLESFGRQVIPCDTIIVLPYNLEREIASKLKDFPGELLVRQGGVLNHARRTR